MGTTTRRRKKKGPVSHVLTKKLIISVEKMKVTELNKWTPVLQSEQTPRLCFEGYVSRIDGQKKRYTAYKTQPLDVRLDSYLFRQANGEVCSLIGELYDPSNSIPLSVKSKLKNGIPKKWQTIAKFWDNMQKHSFYRKHLRSFSSKSECVESLKSSGLLRVSSRGRIIIPSPKYLKGKNVERREIEKAHHLINSQLNVIRNNLDFTPVPKTDGTPKQQVENNFGTINGNKSHHCIMCENLTENPLSKSNFSHKICERSHMQSVQNVESKMKDAHRSSINQRKLLTCKRKLIVAEVQSKMCRSSKYSKNTYEKIENKYYYRCLPHRRKYLLRSTPATRLLQKNNRCTKEPRKTSINTRHNNRIVIPQKKQPEQTKGNLNFLNDRNILQCQDKKITFSCSKRTQEGKGSKEVDLCNEYAVQDSVLETESCSKECRNGNSVNLEKNKRHEALVKLRYKEPCRIFRGIRSDNVLRNCTNRLRKSKQRVCCVDSSDTERPKKDSENSLPTKANRKGLKTFHGTFEDPGSQLSARRSVGNEEPLLYKGHEEINLESTPAGEKGVLAKKVTPQNKSEDISRRERISRNSVTSPLNISKSRQLRLVSNKRQTENRRSTLRNQLKTKVLRRVSDRTRNKSSSTSKSSTAVTPSLKVNADAIENLKEAAIMQGKMVNSASKRRIGNNDRKQPRLSDLQSSTNSESCISSKDTLETQPKKTKRTGPNLSLDPELTDRKASGNVKPLHSKRHEEINVESICAGGLLEKKATSQKISEDTSRKERFSGKSATSTFNSSKCNQSRLVSNEKQTENRRSAIRNRLNEKKLHKVPDRLRKKSLSTCKSSADVTSTTKVNTEDVEHTNEAMTLQENMVNSVSKTKICKNHNRQPKISDLQSPKKTESPIPSKDTLETQPRKTGKSEHNLSLDDIDDILTTGAPRTLKQRKKLRKTIDSYAKSQATCTDLFSDPDYNHLIGDNDPCSSQEWDKDYAEAIEKLVSGKLADQMSLGSTSPAQYLQDFVCDDNQSVRSASPFERTPCDEEFKLRYEHRVLKERNERTRRKSMNMDLLSSFAHRETDASTEADAAYNALIQGKPVPPKLFDLKCKRNNNSSDDSSSECSDEV